MVARAGAHPIWCILDDGPAAGVVQEKPWGTRQILVALDADGATVTHLYEFYGACPQHRIARYRLAPPD